MCCLSTQIVYTNQKGGNHVANDVPANPVAAPTSVKKPEREEVDDLDIDNI